MTTSLPNTSYLPAISPSSIPVISFAPSYADALQLSMVPKAVQNYVVPNKPVKKGAFIFIKINEQDYQRRILLCQNSLIGRPVLVYGENPWKFSYLKARLALFWKVR